MTNYRVVRSAIALGFLAAMTVSVRPTPVQAFPPCLSLCASETGHSGYQGEAALYYFAGCLIGCGLP